MCGIDEVVMRDWDVREQTPIQSETRKRRLVANSVAHHLYSLPWTKEKEWEEGPEEKMWWLPNWMNTHHLPLDGADVWPGPTAVALYST